MNSLQDAYESIINNEKLMENVKVIDIKFFVEPILEKGLTLENISSEYNEYIITTFYDFAIMFENIIIDIEEQENSVWYRDRRDELNYTNFYDINHNEILIKYRIVDDIFEGDSNISGKEVFWRECYIDINGNKFEDRDDAFEYLNNLLADGKSDINCIWWD